MNIRIDQLVRSLLQKDSLDHCSLPELQQFAGRNPYLGAAQLLLAKKMQAENLEGFEDQLQKTLLYFHNPLWVEQLLYDTGNAELIKQKKETLAKEAPASVPDEPVQAHWPEDTSMQVAADTIAADNNSFAVTDPGEKVSVESGPVAANQSATDLPGNLPASPVPEIPEPTPSQVLEALAPEDKKEPKEMTTEKESLLENPAFQSVANDTGLLFEPYHTVDYFASQGIKFREEEKPKDKFGQQLKSFTEWLKTLKKVPATELNRQNEPATEDKVVKLAENSIRDEDVYTEAMAEVWEKQGNSLKAIDIYLKLSLLEPAKSTYFAAKIEELKKLN